MGILTGKIIVGARPAKVRPERTVKSFAEIRPDVPEPEQTVTQADKRLSSYFLVKKESDYLDHNIRNK